MNPSAQSNSEIESAPLLSARHLRCERDERLLFQGLDFDLNPGEILQVEGANGSGKTTLLRIISGLTSAFEGEIQWRGKGLSRVRAAYMAQLHYLGHLPGVKGALSPRENLRWAVSMELTGDEADIELALAKVGLRGFEDVPSFHLSAGQQRRVALAKLYLSRELLWILDEPFTAIDKQGVAELEGLFQAHAAGGGSVVLTTHQALGIDSQVKKVKLGVVD